MCDVTGVALRVTPFFFFFINLSKSFNILYLFIGKIKYYQQLLIFNKKTQ